LKGLEFRLQVGHYEGHSCLHLPTKLFQVSLELELIDVSIHVIHPIHYVRQGGVDLRKLLFNKAHQVLILVLAFLATLLRVGIGHT